MTDIHVFVTEHPGYGWGIQSPQLPELIGGRATRLELDVALRELLAFGGVTAEDRVIIHEQVNLTSDSGDDFTIRVCRDTDRYLARLDVAKTLFSSVNDPAYCKELLGGFLDEGHDPTFVVCLHDDTVGWVMDQMDERGDMVVVVLPGPTVGNMTAIWTTSFIVDPDETTSKRSLSDWGIDRENLVGDLIKAFATVEPSERRIAVGV